MKNNLLLSKPSLLFTFAVFALFLVVSCRQKQDKPWPYYGDVAAEQTAHTKPAQPMP